MNQAISLTTKAGEEQPPVPLFDAVITPPASLDDKGFATFLAITLAIVCLVDLAFLASGLWWAMIFLTGNMVFLLAAFIAVRRGRARSERVLVADGVLRLERRWQGQPGSVDTLPLFGLRLIRVRDADGLCRRLELHHRNDRLGFAADLTAREREQFAEALGRSLHKAGYPIAMPVVTA